MTPNEKREFEQLKKDLADLSNLYYKNNFSAEQDQNKFARFNFRLKIPHAVSLPSSCEQGELLEVSGKLYVASATNTWALAGTQT